MEQIANAIRDTLQLLFNPPRESNAVVVAIAIESTGFGPCRPIAIANASGAEEEKLANWVCSQEPDVVAITEVEDPRTVATLMKFAGSGRRVYVGLRAGSTFDALNHWR